MHPILSVLAQSFSKFEIIIVDDGSKDQTAEIVDSLKDERIKYYFKENEERGAARNYGVKHAKGRYITFLDSDDVLYDNHLYTAYELIQALTEPELLHLGYEIKDENRKVIQKINKRKGNLNQKLIYGNSLSCLGVFIRKDIADNFPFNEDRALSGSEDYELWMRLASRYNIVYSNKITAALIQHQNRSVINFEKQRLIERINLLIYYLFNDKMFEQVYGDRKNIFLAHRYLYLSLHLIMGKYYVDGIKYWVAAIRSHPISLFSQKTLGVFKTLFFTLVS